MTRPRWYPEAQRRYTKVPAEPSTTAPVEVAGIDVEDSTMRKRKVGVVSLVILSVVGAGALALRSALTKPVPAPAPTAIRTDARPFRPARKGTVMVDSRHVFMPERARAVRKTF